MSVNLGNEGLLPARRISSIMESHGNASTLGGASVRILALSSGMGLVACSVLWIVDQRFSLLEVAASLTALVTGICSFVLESNLSFCESSREKMVAKVPIFGKVSGRGSMYACVGMLQCALVDAIHLTVGLFTAAVGIYMIKLGRHASESLSKLKKSITDEKALINAFQSNDRNGDGVLEMFEFEGLILELGVELDNDELDAAFSSIDTNNDKKIAYDEFRTWWKASTADADVCVTL
ncbi:hypothetical protein ACHAXA_000301 [Cyclostephanos tholiformis]|uniref:EF-hand domain-containing protein n=1 Tax=Cyclostephanos tholiformis TaxID=382380 RepID=A0ABD3RHI6_9STRA